MKQETLKRITEIKESDQDFEWYETTPEMINAISRDIVSTYNWGAVSHWGGRGCGIESRTNGIGEDGRCEVKINISSLLDIGCGRGNVFEGIAGYWEKSEECNHRISITTRFGIEKADAQANDLTRRGVAVIGRDYFKTVLLDKKFDVVFSNPPYSIYEEWVEKLLSEVNSEWIYLVIPSRWKQHDRLKKLVQEYGSHEILGSYDFTKAERPARAIVDIVRIKRNPKQKDRFDSWIEENIGSFEKEKDIVIESEEDSPENNLDTKKEKIPILIEEYAKELSNLLSTYKKLQSIDFGLLEQLGITKTGVLTKIKEDIGSLKNKFWRKAIDGLDPIRSRLTHKSRNKMFESITWFKNLDFTEDNIRTIVIWVIENYNNYVKEQLVKCFDDLTNFENVHTYKSNRVWKSGGWRYNNKDIPERYKLDYRIVAMAHLSRYEYNRPENVISDLATVASNLGFSNSGVNRFLDDGKSYDCLKDNGEVLFYYRFYKNGNVHVKADKDFMLAFNIEVGKINNWLMSPEDIVTDFDLSNEDAEKWFSEGRLQLMNNKSPLMLSFAESSD